MVVAGPTPGDDFPADSLGTVPKNPLTPVCTLYYFTETTVPVEVESVVVGDPFATTDDCLGDVPKGPTCAPGAELTAVDPHETDEDAVGCRFAVTLGDEADEGANYDDSVVLLTFSAACTGTSGEPCSRITGRQPSPTAPVTVNWTIEVPLRYCGATDYDDGSGQPSADPLGTGAENGCT